jgi:MerR family transcriptional regulator, light-induced transcriptional regulator
MQMKNFSIAELEQFSLIKAHTFRIWEQRYGICQPNRTPTNLRYYTIPDLSFLLDVALLNRLGTPISKLARIEKAALHQKVLQLQDDAGRQQHLINQLIIYMFSMDIEDFELTLDSAIIHWGIENTIDEIILPFLERIHLFSYKEKTGSEYHFVVTALRKKLIIAIEQATPPTSLPKSALLFLPKGEHYDLMLLYLNFKLRKAGVNVLYLGTNVSFESLRVVLQKKQPEFAVTYMGTLQEKKDDALKMYLANEADTSFFVSIPQTILHQQKSSQNVKYVAYKETTREVLSFV